MVPLILGGPPFRARKRDYGIQGLFELVSELLKGDYFRDYIGGEY